MKRKLQIIVSATALSVLTSVMGQDAPDLKPNGTAYARDGMHRLSYHDRLDGATKASDVMGMEVQNLQNEKLGKVSDLALDVESGRIVEVCISAGGFLGMGNSLVAVPPASLRRDPADKTLRLDVSREKFAATPRFSSSKWDEAMQSNRVVEVYSYYGERPYFVAGNEEQLAGANPADTLPRNMDGSINTDGARAVDKMRNAEIARNDLETNGWISVHRSWAALGQIQKASKLMGDSVKNLQNDKIGKVNNFIIELSSSRIIAVIVNSGGFMGMGDELSAVPPQAFRFDAAHDVLQLDVSKQALLNAPHFKSSQWPDLSQPDYTAGVYQAYRVEPYFANNLNTAPDNTGRNVRDRDDHALTPFDQGNSQADINATATIRKQILANDGMSVNARNVKIITLNGRVTLRGTVNSEQEKSRIGDIARSVAQPGNVDNQLEVSTRAN